ncbi:MAG: DNA replication/repair protein RecF [Pseudomonadota bacterium]
MALTRLTLTDFRNYSHLRLDMDPAPVVLTGPNGAGKTNLLEAVSMLAPGRGLRSAPFAELIRAASSAGPTQWAVASQLHGPLGETRLGTSWSAPDAPLGQPGNRQVMADGKLQKSSGILGEYVRVTWLTPSMDRLFAGPAADRRRFLDRLVLSFDTGHGAQVQAFEKSMRERNRLLEQGSRDDSWLSALEEQMAEAAVAIAAARHSAVRELAGLLARTGTAGQSGQFPWAEIGIDGELEADAGKRPAVEVEEDYRTQLREARREDAAAGRTLNGPHRSDLHVVHGPKGIPARYCSTGEQKALLVGIVLAHARVIQAAFDGYAPLLLLDEVTAHLDENRRQGLFDEILELGAQAWMTGTDPELFASLGSRAQHWAVNEADLERI